MIQVTAPQSSHKQWIIVHMREIQQTSGWCCRKSEEMQDDRWWLQSSLNFVPPLFSHFPPVFFLLCAPLCFFLLCSMCFSSCVFPPVCLPVFFLLCSAVSHPPLDLGFASAGAGCGCFQCGFPNLVKCPLWILWPLKEFIFICCLQFLFWLMFGNLSFFSFFQGNISQLNST